MREGKRFYWSDARFGVFTEKEDPNLRKAICRVMKSAGFSWEVDPEIVKRYKSLSKDRRYGRRRDLEYTYEFAPLMQQLEFFQNVNFENPHGGKFDFNKTSKMPYLVRLEFLRIKRRLTAMLFKRGFRDDSTPTHKTAYDEVMYKRAELMSYHYNHLASRLQCGNNLDANKKVLEDGDIRYFRDYKGRLMRGTVYYNINSMWWVVINKNKFTNLPCRALFEYKEDLPRKICHESRTQQEMWQIHLDKAVKAMNFERAIILRDLINGTPRLRNRRRRTALLRR